MFVTNPGPMPTDSAKPAALIFGYRSSPPFCNLGFHILCANLRCAGCAYHVVRTFTCVAEVALTVGRPMC